jgi:hypothetical protein
MMASLAEVVLFFPLLPDIFMSLRRLPPAGFLWKVAGQLSSFARRRLRQKNKNVFQQLGGTVDAPLGRPKAATRQRGPTSRSVNNYWLQEYPALSEKTRSIITLSFSMLVRPFITRPLRTLFVADTTITPEAAFDGKIIIVDLPIQEFRLAPYHVRRYVDPLGCMIAGFIIMLFLSPKLGVWLVLSGSTLVIYEQARYDKQLDHEFDIQDAIWDSENHQETHIRFTRKQAPL